MYVTFTNRNSSNLPTSITVDAVVTMTKNLPVVGQPGQATITLPATSMALDSNYIDPDGLSRIRIFGDSKLGEWNGWIAEIIERPDATEVHAVEWWGELMKVPVPFNRGFRHVTPDTIVTQAMSASPWPVLTAAVGIPAVAEWTFDGESVWDHIQRMMALSNQELYLTNDNEFRWGLMTGTKYDPVLVAPHDIQATFSTRADERVSQVSARSGNDWYTATKAIHGWSAHAVVKESLTPSGMQVRAENELIRRQQPIRTISGPLTKAHWSIELGDRFSIFVPYARLGAGSLRGCRMIGWTYESGSDRLAVQIQIIADSPVVGVPVGASGGSFVQQVKSEQRRQFRGRQYLGEVA